MARHSAPSAERKSPPGNSPEQLRRRRPRHRHSPLPPNSRRISRGRPITVPVSTPPAVQPVSTAYYFWMMLLFAIPVVGLIVCLVTAFSGEDASRKNFSRAVLIWILVAIVLSIIVAIAIAAVGGSIMNILFNSYRYY